VREQDRVLLWVPRQPLPQLLELFQQLPLRYRRSGVEHAGLTETQPPPPQELPPPPQLPQV
jgi:hypothetical protein